VLIAVHRLAEGFDTNRRTLKNVPYWSAVVSAPIGSNSVEINREDRFNAPPWTIFSILRTLKWITLSIERGSVKRIFTAFMGFVEEN
jgi:hypothetical protein